MPRPKLPDAVRRSVVLRFSITQAQANALDRRAAVAGLGREDFVRWELFGDRVAEPATLTLDTPPPDAVSLSTSERVEVCHRRPSVTEEQADARVQEAQAALDAIAQPLAVCKGCGQETDPDVCYCGASEVDHRWITDHGFIPMGCDCGRAKEDPRTEASAPIAAAPVAASTPCPKCNGAGRIGAPPVRFRCPECLGAGSLARP